MMMIDHEVLIYVDQISNRSCVSVSQSQNCYFPPSRAPQARSEAWEVYPWELHPLDDPPRPSRPKAGLGLVSIMMMMMPQRYGSWKQWFPPRGQSNNTIKRPHPILEVYIYGVNARKTLACKSSVLVPQVFHQRPILRGLPYLSLQKLARLWL